MCLIRNSLLPYQIFLISISAFILLNTVSASGDGELAKKLQNPIANLISLPIKLEWDRGFGENNADRQTYVIQPVIPVSINQDWNLISRTIVPIYIDSESVQSGLPNASGMGDILQSAFFSPSSKTDSGWVWGIGPVLSLPSSSDDALGSGKYSVGPTALALKQSNGWTYGALVNQLWSFAGQSDRNHINATFLQPFLSYTGKSLTTLGFNTESTYDWRTQDWLVPVNAHISQLVRFGDTPVNFLIGYRHYIEKPESGPDNGFRFQVTFIFAK